jgi:hypothetical protein
MIRGEIIMWRLASIALFLCALTATAAGTAQAQSLPTEPVANDGRFSLEMPKGFKQTTAPRPDGGSMQQYTFMWKDQSANENMIGLTVYDVAPGGPAYLPTDARFDSAERGAQARWPGSVISQQVDINSGPAKGRSFTLTLDHGRHVLLTKAYYVDRRLYEMMALVTPDQQASPTVVAFMNSLRILR